MKKWVNDKGERMWPLNGEYLWEILVNHGAKLSFPCQVISTFDSEEYDMSALGYVLKELQNKQLARRVMARGVWTIFLWLFIVGFLCILGM